jgi:hypothetical protein
MHEPGEGDATALVWGRPEEEIRLALFSVEQYEDTPFVPKCKHLLTFADHVRPFILFEKFMKILFILL